MKVKFYIAQWPAHAHFTYLLRRLAKKLQEGICSVIVNIFHRLYLQFLHILLYFVFVRFLLTMLEVTCNDRLGKKVRVKCNSDDTVGDLKKLIAAQTGTKWDRIVLKKWYTIFKDHITLNDYEIHDGMNLELYYH